MSVIYDSVLSKEEPTRVFDISNAKFSYLDTGKLLIGNFSSMLTNVFLDIDMSNITTGMSLKFLIVTDPLPPPPPPILPSPSGRFDYRLFYSNLSITGPKSCLFRRLRQRDVTTGTTIGTTLNNTIPIPISMTPTLIGTSLSTVRGLTLTLHFKLVSDNIIEIYAQEENYE